MPGVLPRVESKVFEVAAGAAGDAIQAAVDQAVAFAKANAGSRPVVHLPQGNYPVSRTIEVPADAQIEIAGDGAYMWPDGAKGTILHWTVDGADGPVLLLKGPSRAILRDFAVAGPKHQGTGPAALPTAKLGAGIAVENCDQENARIYLQECNIMGYFGVGVLADGLDHAHVQVVAHEGGGGCDTWRQELDTVARGRPVRAVSSGAGDRRT